MARVYRKPTTRAGVMFGIEQAGERRAAQIADYVLERIKIYAPYNATRRATRRGTRHLKNAYYFRTNGDGDQVLYSRIRYWKFVEYGTAQHGDAQPHIRPAFLDAARRFRVR